MNVNQDELKLMQDRLVLANQQLFVLKQEYRAKIDDIEGLLKVVVEWLTEVSEDAA